MRYTISFPEKLERILDNCAKENEISKAELLRRAIATYAYLKNELNKYADKGICISLTLEDGTILKDVVIL